MESQNNIFEKINPRKVEIPDTAYFTEMAKSISANQKPIAKVIPLYKKPMLWVTTIAAAVAVIFVFNMETGTEQQFNMQLAFSEVTNEEIFNYIDENIDEFELNDIAEIIPDENLKAMEIFQPISIQKETNLSFDDISEEDIMEYFMEEGIDLNELNESELFFI